MHLFLIGKNTAAAAGLVARAVLRPAPALGWVLGLVLGAMLLFSSAARAQILDDSTKVRYGPRTTRVVREAEVLRDSTAGVPLDTTLTHAPQSRFWLYDSTFQQDLGTMGSASRPLLFAASTQLGARLGRNVFDRFFRNAANTPYYDSRSPYSFFRVVQSSSGEQIFEFSYSRSLKKNFSIGASYERIASNKTLGAISSRDGLVEHNGMLFFGRYQTENERYNLIFSFVAGRHRAIEQGGIRPFASEKRPQDLFKYEKQRVYLTTAQNKDDRDQFHFLQTYRLLGRGLTVFHVFDAQRQFNSYSDQALQLDSASKLVYYPRRVKLRNPFTTLDRAEYRQVENTVGVLGRTAAVEYRLYARRRDYSLASSTLPIVGNPALPGLDTKAQNLAPAFEPLTGGQVFLGGTAAFRYRIYAIEAAGEYKLFDEYWLRASARTGPLSAELLRTSYAPTLTQQRFVGNHYSWENTGFRNTSTDQLTVRLRQRLPGAADHAIELSGAVANINNLVFYNALAEPEQLSDARQLLIGAVRHRVRLGRVVFDNQAIYTRGGDGEGLRIPALVTESRAYYASKLFKNAIAAQTGVEVYCQSRFRGYQYSPSTQQFYVQDSFTIRAYPVVSAYFAADIKTVDIFLKVSYLNEGIYDNGYFATPYYTAYPRRFTLGIKWNFYN